jgi:tRNA(fMet)-specific endonuclease VapC
VHAQVLTQLSASGRLISDHDLWLAAQGIAHGLTLATANVRAFRRVPGLDVEDWTAG